MDSFCERNHNADWLIGVGPRRTATTWLYECLRQTPDVKVPKEKETMFFTDNWDQDIQWYSRQYAPDHCQTIAEVSPEYFTNITALRRISRCNSQCKILIGIRDPVERALSAYRYYRHKGDLTSSVQEALESELVIEGSRYRQYVPKWVSTFGHQNVHFIFMRDLVDDLPGVRKSLARAIGISETEVVLIDHRINVGTRGQASSLYRVGLQVIRRLNSAGFTGAAGMLKSIGNKLRSVVPEVAEREQRDIDINEGSLRSELETYYEGERAFINRLYEREQQKLDR